MSRDQILLLLLVAVWCMMAGPAAAINHIVGGSVGWNLPPNKTYFQDWAKPRVFGVDDRLIFPFRSPLHNVVEVPKEDFANCTQEKLINTYAHGPLVMNFTQPGDHYYYSGIGIQCEMGMKFHITVVAGKGSSGRIFPVTAPAPAPPTSAAAGLVAGFGLVTGLLSSGVWMFL